jgi:hypothetical protein
LRSLDTLHRSLLRREFSFRPSLALHYNFNGKHRTLYIAPWEERIVDLLLYRSLNTRLDAWFSASSYAYRERNYGLDRCQGQIAEVLRSGCSPLYVIKRDIADYFATVNHEKLLAALRPLVATDDYLFQLLERRVRFAYLEDGELQRASLGIPFGTAIACLFANIYLTGLDRRIESIPEVRYFRYADDVLIMSPCRASAVHAGELLDSTLFELHLRLKASHRADLAIASQAIAPDSLFTAARDFRHLGLLFRAGGEVALARDKLRKIENLFRFAFRRGRRRWKRPADPHDRVHVLVAIAQETIEEGLRNVAILDYYLKHVNDEDQLRELDRWLAEEILSLVFGGHKKGHFRRISFQTLRSMGLPSLLHRQRLIRRGRVESPFFIWQRERSIRAFRGTVARPRDARAAFSSVPEAAAGTSP